MFVGHLLQITFTSMNQETVPAFHNDRVFYPTKECYGVLAQYRFQCVLGEVGRFQEGTGFRDAMGLEGGSKVEWVLTGSGFPRFADQFRELVPGFARFRGSESGNFVRGGIVKPPGCWGYCLRLLVLEVHGLRILQVTTAKKTPNWAKSCAAPLWTLLVTWTGLPHGKTYWNPPSAER